LQPEHVERAALVGPNDVERAHGIEELNQMAGIAGSVDIREVAPNVSLV
jgi:hypothetical protein